VDMVILTCLTLLAIININRSLVIQLSHFSVKEFLMSDCLAEANDKILKCYYISMAPAHTLIAQACLGILLYLDTIITNDNLQSYPVTAASM